MRNVFEGAIVAVIGIGAIWGAWQVPASAANETWAGLVPMIIACSLLLLGCAMVLARALEVPVSAVAEGKQARFRMPADVLAVLGLLGLSLAYYQLIQLFGYLLATAIVAPMMLFAFGVRGYTGLAISIVLCPLFFHIIFFELLGVYPPYGELFDLLDLIRP